MLREPEKIEELIGYRFKSRDYLETAFTHSSYSNEHKAENNERLEFLGDSVLGLVVSDFLFSRTPTLAAGRMTSEKQKLVSTVPLSGVIKRLGLGAYLLCGKSLNPASLPDSILENLCESVIGAIYLDGGLSAAESFVRKFVLCDDSLSRSGGLKDYKSELQIYSPKLKTGLPKYELVSKTGPDHAPCFTVSVKVAGIKTEGSGKCEQKAEQQAAENALKILTGRKN